MMSANKKWPVVALFSILALAGIAVLFGGEELALIFAFKFVAS